MRLLPSDPDVETIVSRIFSGDINLQPEFQRGEVWSKPKKQRLIDSILRDWHVPPIHVIENPHTRKQEVLDGQQRLVAIRDFVQGLMAVDGSIPPLDESIKSLDGCYYKDLPPEWRRRFNQFTIRVFRIVDFRASEPAELFFRLNQPVGLTGAEQRNAFFGPVREQIRDLVEGLSDRRIDKNILGFSNSRMAYDDVFSRVALAIERRSIAEKITASSLADLYRQEQPLAQQTVALINHAVQSVAEASLWSRSTLRFNKATLFSWLIFIVRARLSEYPGLHPPELSAFLDYFQDLRNSVFHDDRLARRYVGGLPGGVLYTVYESRSSARVADVSSVLLRDAILWLVYEQFATELEPTAPLGLLKLDKLHRALNPAAFMEEDEVAKGLIDTGWGALA